MGKWREQQQPGQYAGFARCDRASLKVGPPIDPGPARLYGLQAARWTAGFAAASTANRFAAASQTLRPTRYAFGFAARPAHSTKLLLLRLKVKGHLRDYRLLWQGSCCVGDRGLSAGFGAVPCRAA